MSGEPCIPDRPQTPGWKLAHTSGGDFRVDHVIREEVSLNVDDVDLVGSLTLPQTPSVPLVIGVHGAEGGTRQFHLFRHLESTLPPAGIGTLVYDRRGEGDSGGARANTTYELLAADVRAWMRHCAADGRI